MRGQVPGDFAVAVEELALPVAVQDGDHVVTMHRAGPKHETCIVRSKVNGVEVFLRLLINIHRLCVASLDNQLVANLVQNALRYGAARQTISIQLHGNRLVFSDEGPGIPFEEREKVLVPLYQGEETRQNDGFGLGLSLVNAIAELHSAQLLLSDGPNGRGLSVCVVFTEQS